VIEIGLREEEKTLSLYTQSPFHNSPPGLGNDDNDFIELVKDLNRKYGDPVIHYTAKASSLKANGKEVSLSTRSRRKIPTYVIFDTGVTGMVVSQDLFDQRYAVDQRYADARLNREKSLWGSVEISFLTHQGNIVTLSAQKPVTTPLGDKPWPKFQNANLIVLGLAFLDGYDIIIDMDNQKMQIS